jgi:peptidoglycan-associated lipoprotein
MSVPTNTTLFLAVALLIAGGLACKKPAPAPAPAPVAAPAPAPAKTDDGAARRAAEDTKRNSEEAEAARKAAAEAAYRNAAQAALKDIHFDFDKSDVRESDKAVLAAIADFMKAYSQANVKVEGNCDERGTVEYNLALGDRRANAAMTYLAGLGVSSSRLSTVSFGKEKPICTEATESCWGKNRRAHFSLK